MNDSMIQSKNVKKNSVSKREYKNKCATIYSCTFWSKDDIMLIKERIIWDRKTN